jgi:hypothetical protein
MDQAKAILNREDWSACAPLFQLSVAAVREDVGAVIKLMKSIGKDGSPNAEDYRLWPVFRGLTDNVQFKEAFENIFGIPLIRPTTSKVPLGSKPTPKKVIAKVPPTRH